MTAYAERRELQRQATHACEDSNPLRAAHLEQRLARHDASASRPASLISRSTSNRGDTPRSDVEQFT